MLNTGDAVEKLQSIFDTAGLTKSNVLFKWEINLKGPILNLFIRTGKQSKHMTVIASDTASDVFKQMCFALI